MDFSHHTLLVLPGSWALLCAVALWICIHACALWSNLQGADHSVLYIGQWDERPWRT